MKTHLYLQDFDEEDLISFNERDKILRIQKVKNSCSNTFISTNSEGQTIGKTAQALHVDLAEKIVSSADWLGEGVECEVLRLGDKQWTKGRVRVRVIIEFDPDEEVKPLSELDAFREEEDCSPRDSVS
jgi:KGK domain